MEQGNIVITLLLGIGIIMLAVGVTAYLRTPAGQRNPPRKPLPKSTRLFIALFTIGFGAIQFVDQRNIYAGFGTIVWVSSGVYLLTQLKKETPKT